MEKIATSWALKGIDTLEKAQNAVNIQPAKRYSKVPDFKNNSYEKTEESQSYDDLMNKLFNKEGN